MPTDILNCYDIVIKLANWQKNIGGPKNIERISLISSLKSRLIKFELKKDQNEVLMSYMSIVFLVI